MRPLLSTLFTALVLVTAGCIASTNPEPAPAGPLITTGPVDPIVDKHDHRDPAEHPFAHNMELLAWRPLVEQGKYTGAHAVDIWENYLFVETGDAMRDKDPGPTGFTILDIADPANPVVVGSYEDPNLVSGDRTLMVSEDGKYVFIASEASNNRGGVYAIDVSDMANPKQVAFYQIPSYGSHTVFAKMIDGKHYVYALSVGVHILRLDDAPIGGGKALNLVGRYATASAEQLAQAPKSDEARTYAFRDLYGHDLFVTVDNETKKVTMYVAMAYEGLTIVDITNPTVPQELSKWVPKDAHSPYYVHTVHVDWVDGKRIIAVGSEVFENRHTETPSPVWFLDGTDLKKPQLVSTWINPGGHGAQGLLFSAHDLRIENGRVYLSHYHAGIWVLDISTAENLTAPKTLGYYAAGQDNGWRPGERCCIGFNLGAIPLFFDVEVKDGIAYGACMYTGIYVLKLQDPNGVPATE